MNKEGNIYDLKCIHKILFKDVANIILIYNSSKYNNDITKYFPDYVHKHLPYILDNYKFCFDSSDNIVDVYLNPKNGKIKLLFQQIKV